MSDDLDRDRRAWRGQAIHDLEAPYRAIAEARLRVMNDAKPVDDRTLIESVTRLELAGYLPAGCTNRVVELVAFAGIGWDPAA